MAPRIKATNLKIFQATLPMTQKKSKPHIAPTKNTIMAIIMTFFLSILMKSCHQSSQSTIIYDYVRDDFYHETQKN